LQELARFNTGKQAFLHVEDVAGGLGPVFTESSCVKCHSAGATGGAGTRLVTRFGRITAGQFDPMVAFGGSQIQDNGIGLFNGVDFVGEVVPPQATILAHRRTIPLFGLGLVDAVPDGQLLMLAQLQHMMTPQTAGRPSIVVDPVTGQNRIGKFGWKGQQPTVFAFSGDAYLNEIGVTTPLFPHENCPQGDCALLVADPGASPTNDPDNSTIQQLADFVAFLAPPPRGPVGRNEIEGEETFIRIGCANCHTQSFQTGPSPIRALSFVEFSPFSDFLLHDMGSLGDGIVQNGTGQREMRTAPLWGLRFQTTLLHDGRAKTISDAILAHDGQSKAARDRFAQLGERQLMQLLAFLNSL
jgi:CxxC motif-containing protein (DUF1111 family)